MIVSFRSMLPQTADRCRPNLFLIGAMKSGSSSLARHLRAHPSIFMASRPKEPSYFVDPDQLREVYRSIWEMGFWQSEERYLSLFEGAAGCPVIGEASQNYARLSRVTGVAERIAEFNPDARFIYIMRDPIQRTISHYWYMVNSYGEGRPMLTAVREDPDYTETSYYAMQLQPYRRIFGADRIMTLTLEEMRDDPVGILQGVFGWLGVDSDFVPPAADRRANVTPRESSVMRGSGVVHALAHSRLWGALGPRIPAWMRGIGRRLAEKRIARDDVPTDDVEEYLRPIQQAQTRELEDMLGRAFPEWSTLSADG